MILNETLRTGSDTYKTNWLVSNCRYDVLLGIPWHVKFKPTVRYVIITFRVNNSKKSIGPSTKTEEQAFSVEVTSLSVKKFR